MIVIFAQSLPHINKMVVLVLPYSHHRNQIVVYMLLLYLQCVQFPTVPTQMVPLQRRFQEWPCSYLQATTPCSGSILLNTALGGGLRSGHPMATKTQNTNKSWAPSLHTDVFKMTLLLCPCSARTFVCLNWTWKVQKLIQHANNGSTSECNICYW